MTYVYISHLLLQLSKILVDVSHDALPDTGASEPLQLTEATGGDWQDSERNATAAMGFLDGLANLPRSLAEDLRMNRTQALVVFTSFWCWATGSMQFYLLPYTQPDLAKALGIAQSQVAYANTTSMLSRSIGALLFGILSDQYGRKMPLLACLTLMGVFTFCSGLVNAYGALIGVRFLYGM